MSKKTVALVVSDFRESGGLQTIALHLREILLKSGRYDPEIVSVATSAIDRNSTRLLKPSTWFDGVRVTHETVKGVSFRHVGAVGTEIEVLRYRPRAVLDEILNRFDLVQVIAGGPALAMVAGRFRGPIVLQVATLAAVERETALRAAPRPGRWWRRAMTRFCTRLEPQAVTMASALFIANRWLFQKLAADVGRKAIYAPHGVDETRFRPGVYRDDGHLIAVGRLSDPRKNISLLFEAYAMIRRRLPGAPKLVLAGESMPTDADFAQAERLGLLPFVEMHRSVDGEQLTALLQGASMLLLSSNEEGFGLTVIEAMACGLPVISTRCGGPADTIADGVTGYLVAVGDAKSMANRAGDILTSPGLGRQMGQRGRDAVLQRFTAERWGGLFLDKYDELLAEHETRNPGGIIRHARAEAASATIDADDDSIGSRDGTRPLGGHPRAALRLRRSRVRHPGGLA